MSKQLFSIEDGDISKTQMKALKKYKKQTLEQETPKPYIKERDTSNDLPSIAPKFLQNGFWTFPVRRPNHTVSGIHLSAANPFAAADLYDPLGPVIGIEKMSGGRPFTFDPWELYFQGFCASPNLLIEGTLRQGKSWIIKRIITLLVEIGHFAINTSDSKGEHGVVAEALGGTVFKMGVFGSEIRLNPLEASELRLNESPELYDARVKAARIAVLQQLGTLLNPGERPVTSRESALIDWALTEVAKETSNNPTVGKVWEKLSSPELALAQGGYFNAADAQDLRDGFRRLVHGDLGGMFDKESSVKIDPASPYTVIDTFAISQRGSGALAITQTVTNAWVQNTISNKDSGRRYFLIREEGWRDMKSVAALEAHQEQLKLSGEYGISMVLIVHEGGDFDSVGPEGSKERELAKSLLRGYANRICFLQPEAALKNAVKDGTYTQAEADVIGTLNRGQFLLKLKNRSYIVDGNPTTTSWERALFDTDRQMRANVVAAQ